VSAKHALSATLALRQDEDVLDTWFSSALWPFSTLGWPERTAQLARFYPTNVLVTGFDIIFFWVARMLMMGLKFMDDVPFRDVYITGLVLDEHGEKMSKTKGNVIDPLDIIDGIDLESLVAKRTRGLMQPQLAPEIEKATRKAYPQGIAAHGTDALRFTFAALASANRDIRFDLQRVGGYRNFCNKLWNAARFVTLMVPDGESSSGAAAELSVADRWIRARFGRRLAEVESALASYRFDFAAAALYEFTWDEFCSWYLELTKPVLQSDSTSEAAKFGTRRTLAQILEALQRALHPLMPFITEEIWQKTAALAGRGGATIMLEPYPAAADYPADPAAEAEIAWLQSFILGVRQIRGEMDINPAKRIPVLVKEPSAGDRASIERHRSYLERLAGIERIAVLERGAAAPQAATAMVGDLTILVPMANLIDAAAETERLGKRLAKTRQELEKTRAQLGNENFVGNAPAAVVGALRERAAELERTAVGLEAQLQRVRALQSA
jgi:valyl-tRNA synthetase